MNRLLAFFVVAAALSSTAAADSFPVINLINNSGQDAGTVLRSGAVFTTNFLGTNDVTMQAISGKNEVGDDSATFPVSGNNPSYLTGFIGSTANGTGNGTPGDLDNFIGGSTDGSTFQINFAIPIGPSNPILFFDIDFHEKVTIQAFNSNGPVSLTGWTLENLTGGTGIADPDQSGEWAKWNPTAGTLTSAVDKDLGDPISMLIPNQSVTELILTMNKEVGGVGFQVLSVPEPSTAVLTSTAVGVLLSYWGLRRKAPPRVAAARD